MKADEWVKQAFPGSGYVIEDKLYFIIDQAGKRISDGKEQLASAYSDCRKKHDPCRRRDAEKELLQISVPPAIIQKLGGKVYLRQVLYRHLEELLARRSRPSEHAGYPIL